MYTKEWKQYKKVLSEKMKDDEAFTLIELIVVMAILAILVLLAAPQFLGYTKKAKVANIQNDTAVVEGNVNEGFVLERDNYAIEEWADISEETLTQAFENDELYGKGGLLEEFDPTGDWKIVPSNIKNDVGSHLDGTFYTTEDGEVIYHDNNLEGEIVKDIEIIQDEIIMLLTDVSLITDWDLADSGQLSDDSSNGLVYDENGKVTSINPDDPYYVVPDSVITSNRGGSYYADENGKVIYVEKSNNSNRIPGSNRLVAGDGTGDNGIYDAIQSEGFFLNDTSIFPTPDNVTNRVAAPWMKLEYDGSTLFVPQQPIGHITNPTSTPTKFSYNGVIYQARLFTNTEWDNIMYPIHENASTLGAGVYEHGLGTGDNRQFSSSDLGLGDYGTLIDGGVVRGHNYNVQSSTFGTNGNYRPIVEVIGFGVVETDGDSEGVDETPDDSDDRFRQLITEGYVLAQDDDFEFIEGTSYSPSYYKYTGNDTKVIIPKEINGVLLESYHRMFSGSYTPGSSPIVTAVAAEDSSNVIDMSYMFNRLDSSSLDLSNLDTSSVTNMSYMFEQSKVTNLNLTGFDTSSVTNMRYMFSYLLAQQNKLDLSDFDTSNVTDMHGMFDSSRVTVLDLSSFDTTNATTKDMFWYATARTGYARTSSDAIKLNQGLRDNRNNLRFVVHPDLK